jgi:hypothetical protein
MVKGYGVCKNQSVSIGKLCFIVSIREFLRGKQSENAQNPCQQRKTANNNDKQKKQAKKEKTKRLFRAI